MKLVSIHKHVLALLLSLLAFQVASAQMWSMEQCIDTALVANKNLQMGRNNLEMVTAKQREAKANLIPKLTANADYKYFTNIPYQLLPLSIFGGPEGQFKEAQFGVPHNANANLQLTLPIYNPQLYGAIETSKIAADFTTLQYRKSEEQIVFEVSNLYYNAVILHHQMVFADSNLVNVQKLAKNLQLLQDQLMAKGTDVSKLQLQAAQLATQRALLESKYLQILNALKFVMGLPPDHTIEIDHRIVYTNNAEYNKSSTIDIQLAEMQYRLLTRDMVTLRNSKLPSLSLFGTLGTTGYGYDKQPNAFFKLYPIGFVGIQASYPLFNGTVTQRKIDQKRIELENADLQVAYLMDQNAMQIANAKAQRQATQRSIETFTLQIQLSQTIYAQTVLQLKQGLATLTEILLADNALRESQQGYLAAVVEFLKADLELKKLTGNISTQKAN